MLFAPTTAVFLMGLLPAAPASLSEHAQTSGPVPAINDVFSPSEFKGQSPSIIPHVVNTSIQGFLLPQQPALPSHVLAIDALATEKKTIYKESIHKE